MPWTLVLLVGMGLYLIGDRDCSARKLVDVVDLYIPWEGQVMAHQLER